MTASPLSSPSMEPGSRSVYRHRESCRACGSADLERVLALGDQPLANALLARVADFDGESFFPLDLVFCRGCSLVQILDVVDPEVLFGHYLYLTGTSETIAEHNERYAASVMARMGLGPGHLVAEIASNDGSLLSCFKSRGVRVLGIEPARNIAEMARQRGIETLGRFFDRQAGAEIAAAHGPASAIIGNNVFAHVDDPVGFLRGCVDMLTDDGLVFIECPYALDMMERGEYDTIYHEHLSYFSVTSLARVAESAGLTLESVERVPVHGGSIRTAFRKGGSHAAQPTAMMAMEGDQGVTSLERWRAFGEAASRNRSDLLQLLGRLRTNGATLAAYGAPAKGNTLLNYCGIGTDLIPWTVDRNPLKVGLYTPGMHVPVLPVETVMERRPDYLLVLPWNFSDEIMRQQRAYSEAGGRFILPIPTPRIV